MLNRRSFLWLTSLGGVTAACSPSPAPTKSSESAAEQALPASIAALTSMKDQATPITADERRARAERARTLMAEHRIDALMLTSGTSMVYFANVDWSGGERLFAVVIPQKGEPFAVCPSFEEERAREQLALGPFTGTFDVRTWQEHESPYALVAAGLKDRGIVSGRIGIEETTKFVFSDGVAQAAPAVTLTSGTPITAGCRMVKDAHEQALMRLASQVTLRAYEAAYRALAEGMTQNDFARLVAQAHDKLGFAGGAGVQVGQYSALPHGSIQPQVVREGTILLIDGGCKVEGYSSDLSRTFVLGKPTQKMKDVFAIERRAQDAALAAAKPGVECQAVDAAARKVIVDAGYGPDYTYFTHRVGHGMGMDGHEWPYLTRGNTLKLQPGMTFSDEPGIYIRGEFGVRLEDDMLITESGAELFTPQSESLEKPF
ncbi:MAG TPA: Xaa-Pro peptidase family protein [Vicinamibacterales bacterium]|nr:Xaa-Pro peptidase family protein [Vicinamibacterales bacterium]